MMEAIKVRLIPCRGRFRAAALLGATLGFAVGCVGGCDDGQGSATNPDGMSTADGAADMVRDAVDTNMAYDAPAWWLDMAQLPPCDPALSLTPLTTSAYPRGIATFEAAGGTGEYRYELEVNNSGGGIASDIGSYVAGDLAGVDDTVIVTDAGCLGEARATVSVVPGLVLVPSDVTTRPGTSFQFETTGGTGTVTYALSGSGSGGSVSAGGNYTAGGSNGVDVIRATDTVTGQVVDARVAIVSGMSFTLDPPVVGLPVGQSFNVRSVGGSGHMDGSGGGGVATLADSVLTATGPGSTTLNVTDRFTGDTATLTVLASAPVEWSAVRTGDQTQSGAFPSVAPGDLDGDGFPELVVGIAEADIAGHNSGAVFIYKGQAGGGFDPVPARIISGDRRGDSLGMRVELADITGDNVLDLIATAHESDLNLDSSGAVHIYAGVPGELFASERTAAITGGYRSDRFGHSLATCDFNGDGFTDLAVGARYAEDRRISPLVSNQGAVYIFLGSAGGISLTPDDAVYGELPDNGGMTYTQDLNLGTELAAGDIDGDGLCDLAVGALYYSSTAYADGAIMIYRGRADSDVQFGGIEKHPSRVIGSTGSAASASQFSRYMAAGDLDGDGLSEIAISHYNYDGSETRNGAVRILRGGPLGGDATTVEPTESLAFNIEGDNSYDRFGWSVAITDMNGDGLDDLLVGSQNDEVVDGTNSTGVVRAYYGVSGALPLTTASLELPGGEASQYFGTHMGPLGDLDGDGITDLGVAAGYDSTFGYRVGRTYAWTSANGASSGMDLPGEASGSRLGSAVAVVEQGSRTFVAAGAPDAGTNSSVDVGHVGIYEVTGGGTNLVATLGGFAGHSGDDELGYDLANAGDFDGDGVADLVVIARSDEQPSDGFDASYAEIGSCPARISGSGAVFVFKGNGSGFDPSPAFVHYGPNNDNLYRVTGNLDINGDGLQDVVFGSYTWDDSASNAGGYGVIYGRPQPTPGVINVICDADELFNGGASSDEMARSLSTAGDVDGDGCDDLAVGVRLHDGDSSNVGAVEIHFGWDPAGLNCAAARQRVAFDVDIGSAYLGTQVVGGSDVDGDGLDDVVAAAVRYHNMGADRGRVVVLRSSYINGLPRVAATSGARPNTHHPAVQPNIGELVYLDGAVTGEEFGQGLALLDGAGPGGRALVAVGRPLGTVGGPARAGGVSIYQYTASGFDTAPVAELGGEPTMTEPLFGGALAAQSGTIIVGSSRSSAISLDEGSAYVFSIP